MKLHDGSKWTNFLILKQIDNDLWAVPRFPKAAVALNKRSFYAGASTLASVKLQEEGLRRGAFAQSLLNAHSDDEHSRLVVHGISYGKVVYTKSTYLRQVRAFLPGHEWQDVTIGKSHC